MKTPTPIRVGQLWESRDRRDPEVYTEVLAVSEADNGFVYVKRLVKSRMRKNTLRTRYRLVADANDH